MEAEFDILATKVLAGEASPEEQAHLDALLARDPQRRSEFAELQAAWEAMRKFGPLTTALDAPPTPLPQHRLAGLQAGVRNHFSSRAREQSDSFSIFDLLHQWFQSPRMLAGAVTAVVLICGLFLVVRPGSGKSRETVAWLLAGEGEPEVVRGGKTVALSATTALQPSDELHLNDGVAVSIITPAGSLSLKGPQRLRAEKLNALVESGRATAPRPANRSSATVQTALFGSLKQLAPLLAVMRDTQGTTLYSPRDATRSLTPLILWKSEPGKTYDLTITDEFDRGAPPWQLRGVVSPVDFGKVEAWKGRPLGRDGLYRILIRETGNPLSNCEYTFRTLKEANGTLATTPSEKIARAYQLLTSETPAPGDALAELMALPPEFGDQPLVLRLKLALFGQLGLQEDYEATAAKLNPPSDTQPR